MKRRITWKTRLNHCWELPIFALETFRKTAGVYVSGTLHRDPSHMDCNLCIPECRGKQDGRVLNSVCNMDKPSQISIISRFISRDCPCTATLWKSLPLSPIYILRTGHVPCPLCRKSRRLQTFGLFIPSRPIPHISLLILLFHSFDISVCFILTPLSIPLRSPFRFVGRVCQ